MGISQYDEEIIKLHEEIKEVERKYESFSGIVTIIICTSMLLLLTSVFIFVLGVDRRYDTWGDLRSAFLSSEGGVMSLCCAGICFVCFIISFCYDFRCSRKVSEKERRIAELYDAKDGE